MARSMYGYLMNRNEESGENIGLLWKKLSMWVQSSQGNYVSVTAPDKFKHSAIL